MPLLDVSDVLFDPDFVDTSLVCERSTQAEGSNGRAVNTTTNTSFAGVVTSDKGDILDRFDAGDRVKGSINIHTIFALNDGGGSGQAPDIVQWGGRRYTVANVNDYSPFGRGFVCANCELIEIAG